MRHDHPVASGAAAPSVGVPWPLVLRAIREARSVTQDGWGYRFGVSRRTVQRWERGELAPDAAVEAAIAAYCAETGLFRSFGRGVLQGLVLTPELLRDLLADGRLAAARGGTQPRAEHPAPSAVPTNLPAPLTSFVGRERERAAVQELVQRPDVRLVTLTGAPGIGKTRLALAVAADLLPAFPDGVWFVPLAPVTDPDLVLPAVAHAVGVRDVRDVQDEGIWPRQETLHDALRGRRTLLVLDNCEHLVAATAPRVAELLAACRHLKVLATGRAALRLSGEHLYDVPPLALPPPGSREPGRPLPSAEELVRYAAVRLFVARAREAAHDFALTPANGASVAALCRRLDGVPLALELAAARVKLLPPPALLDRLGNRLDLLTGGARDLPARQQTLRRAIEWSYDLLGEPERRLFRRLAVFVGGFTLEAAAAVCAAAGDSGDDVVEGVGSLADQSLVRPGEGPAGEPRFEMLETLREFARERLEASGGEEAVHDRHAAYHLALAERAEPTLSGPDQAAWLDRLEREHGNLREALRWAIERAQGAPVSAPDRALAAQLALRLGGALCHFWARRGHGAEGRRWLAAALAAPAAHTRAPSVWLAWALLAAGRLAWNQGEAAPARPLFEEGLSLFRVLGDRAGIAEALRCLAGQAEEERDYAAARPLAEESLARFRALGELRGVAAALDQLGGIAWRQGDDAAARALYTQSLALRRQLGDTWGVGRMLSLLGFVHRLQGQYAAARPLLEQGIARFRELGDSHATAKSLAELASVAAAAGDPARAAGLYQESVALFRQLSDQPRLATALADLGDLAQARHDCEGARASYAESLALFHRLGYGRRVVDLLEKLGQAALHRSGRSSATAGVIGEAERATRLLGAVAALRETFGGATDAGREEHAPAPAAAWAALGDAAAAAWSAGQAMTLEQAVACALEEVPSAA